MNSKAWRNFEDMINFIYSIHRVKYDISNWTLSSCTCWHWQKHYKCHHLISIAARKKKCNFDSVGMDIPIQSNRNKGRPKRTLRAFQFQPKETQSSSSDPKGIESDGETDQSIVEPVSKKSKSQSVCEKEVKKCDTYDQKKILVLSK